MSDLENTINDAFERRADIVGHESAAQLEVALVDERGASFDFDAPIIGTLLLVDE